MAGMMTWVLLLPNSRVSPFGVERATSPAPITPPPPPLFSGTDGAELGLHALPPKPADHVGRASRGEWNDQPDGPFRECGECGDGQGRGRKRGHSVLEKIATIHRGFLGKDCVEALPYANRAARETTATRRSRL
jgi:hypothetical protein